MAGYLTTNDAPGQHAASWYAATAGEVPDHPELQGDTRADVCVVGGGYGGLSAALHLAERGLDVALVEANRIGWGASGRNGGQLINGISGLAKIRKKHGEGIADMLWDLKWRGNDIVHDRVARYGIACDLKNGFVEAAGKPRHMVDLEQYAEEMDAHDFAYEYALWDREKTREMLGTDAYIGGFSNYRDGHLHPLNLCIGEARAAHDLGVQIFEQSPVTNIEHGDRPKVHTASGYVEADSVVLAGNAYHLLEPKHLANLTFPAGSYIIATEPLPDEMVNQINPTDVAVCDLNEIMDYYRLSADKRMLYGGQCNYSGREPASIMASIVPRMLKVYPQLKNVKIEYEWGGMIGIVLNRIPALGRIKKNVYYCQGYSGHGVNVTHLAGQILADAIAGTFERFDIFARIKPVTVPGSGILAKPMVALGMVYYSLKDLL